MDTVLCDVIVCLLSDSGVFVCLLSDSGVSPAKKQPRYELSKEMKQWISEDEANKKIWDELLRTANNNSVCVVLCARVCVCGDVHTHEINDISFI